MRISLSAPRILLMIGDDGIVTVPYHLPDAAPFFTSVEDRGAVQDILSFLAQYPQAHIILCADNLAQDYRNDTLPRLNIFDRKKLISRRLKQHFPLARLAAGLNFRKTRGRVLMIGLHESNPVFAWAERLKKRLPRLVLLPVEGARLIERLMPEAKEGWAMLISRQKTGGFRQIVTYRNDLVFTRLTPLPPSDDSDDVARAIAGDIKASLDYLMRHGLRDAKELSVLLLLPQDMHEHQDFGALKVKAINSLSPSTAAHDLKLPFAPAIDDALSDLLFAGSILSQGRPVLPLMLPDTRQIWAVQTTRLWGMRTACVALLAVLLISLWHAGNLLTTLYQTQREAAQLQQTRHILAQAQASAAPVTEPLGRMRQALERRHIYDQAQAMPWHGIDELLGAIDDHVKIDKLEWDKDKDKAPEIFSVSLRVDPAENNDRAATVAAFSQATQNIARAMPDYTVTVTKPPYPALPQEAVTASAAAADDPSGEINLRRIDHD